MNNILLVLFSSIAIFLILSKPYLGVVFTLVSLPVVDLLPTIPFLTSIVVLIGVVTLAGFLIHRKKELGKRLFNFGSVHGVGLLFVGWVSISYFQGNLFLSSRNWAFTFIQLWLLIWLAGELLDSPEKHHVFMWMFSLVSAIAAIISIQQGNIGDTISTSTRAIGLAGNPNGTGRYLVVAMLFFNYLGTVTTKRFLRLLAVGGAIITFLGVFFTLSRSAILILIVSVLLQNIFYARRKASFQLILTYIIAGFVIWFLSDQIMSIIKSIMPSILQGTDTVGVRYKLWQAAWRMWLDHVFQGVGIGMYPIYLKYYAQGLAPHYWNSYPHNTYLSALAETGLVGFVLFFLLLGLSFRNFVQSGKAEDVKMISLRHVWLIVFVAVLLGEITANGLYDKLLWFLFGISVYFRSQYLAKLPEPVVNKHVRRSSIPTWQRR